MYIQPVNIWNNGVIKTAERISLKSVYDDLATAANFFYELKNADNQTVASGNLIMNGTDYENWGSEGDINAEAYQWAAGKLNLTILDPQPVPEP